MSGLSASQAGERFVYDDLGRLIEVVDEVGNQTTYTYHAAGNILSVQSSTGPVQPPAIVSVTSASEVLGARRGAKTVTIAALGETIRRFHRGEA